MYNMPSGASRINSANAFANYTGLTTSDERERERERTLFAKKAHQKGNCPSTLAPM